MASSTLSSMKLCERLRAARFLLRNRYLGRQLRLQRERSASNGCLVTTWRQRKGGSEGCRIERERGDTESETEREKNREIVRERQGGGERGREGERERERRGIYIVIKVYTCTYNVHQ